MPNFLQIVRERVVVYDGAMGTNIQLRNPTLDDYWGKENCSEVLVLSRPDIIRDVHAGFLQVGCDVVETNTFGATRTVLTEFDLADRVREINLAAAKLAREAADQFSTKAHPRFVAGSMGPTTKLPSLGHITFDAMVEAYEEQAAALIEGGVDILLIETAQDLLQAKIAVVGVIDAMRKAGKRLPITVQVTLQESGVMLLGTEIGAALTALEPYDVDIIGLNCATGPAEMNEAVRYLALNSTKEVSVLPNAGLPQNEGGHAVYKLTPAELAKFHKHFVVDYGVRIVGGCCGTKPEHLKAVVDAVSGIEPAKREVKAVGAASSAYTSVPLDLEPKPLIVAEEMNTTTRVEHFRKLVQAKKYDDILTLAKKLANEGSLFLDEIGDMTLQTQAKVLRVLETQVFQRVGGAKSIKVDVRIIAATNKDLEEEVKKGNFREDLFFRLNVIPILVPPLRERKDDIPQLAKFFIEVFASESGIRQKELDHEVIRLFQSYSWPGNIRELRNAVERLMIMVPSTVITASDIAALGMLDPSRSVRENDFFSYATLKDARDAFEKDYICRKLQENDWNISRTADAISVERSNLHKKIKSYGISENRIKS